MATLFARRKDHVGIGDGAVRDRMVLPIAPREPKVCAFRHSARFSADHSRGISCARPTIASLAALLAASAALSAQALARQPADFDAARAAPASPPARSAAALMQHMRELAAAKSSAHHDFPSHFDRTLGVSTFLWLDASRAAPSLMPLKDATQRTESATRQVLTEHAADSRSRARPIADAGLLEVHDLGSGPLIARYQQMHNGVEVFGRRLSTSCSTASQRPVAVCPATSAAAAADETADGLRQHDSLVPRRARGLLRTWAISSPARHAFRSCMATTVTVYTPVTGKARAGDIELRGRPARQAALLPARRPQCARLVCAGEGPRRSTAATSTTTATSSPPSTCSVLFRKKPGRQ